MIAPEADQDEPSGSHKYCICSDPFPMPTRLPTTRNSKLFWGRTYKGVMFSHCEPLSQFIKFKPKMFRPRKVSYLVSISVIQYFHKCANRIESQCYRSTETRIRDRLTRTYLSKIMPSVFLSKFSSGYCKWRLHMVNTPFILKQWMATFLSFITDFIFSANDETSRLSWNRCSNWLLVREILWLVLLQEYFSDLQ